MTTTDTFCCDLCGNNLPLDQIGRRMAADGDTAFWCNACTPEEIFYADQLIAALKDRGVDSLLCHTGGGCVTLYAGPLMGKDSDEGDRYVAAIGPMESHPDGVVCFWDELSFGADNDDYDAAIIWHGGADVDGVADSIASHMDEWTAAVSTFISEGANA